MALKVVHLLLSLSSTYLLAVCTRCLLTLCLSYRKEKLLFSLEKKFFFFLQNLINFHSFPLVSTFCLCLFFFPAQLRLTFSKPPNCFTPFKISHQHRKRISRQNNHTVSSNFPFQKKKRTIVGSLADICEVLRAASFKKSFEALHFSSSNVKRKSIT